MTSATPYAMYLAFVLGAAGLYFILPRVGASKAAIGATLGVTALVGLFVVAGSQGSAEPRDGIYFYLFSALAIVAAVRVITHPKPVYSAIYFLAVVVAVAALLLFQGAEFLAVSLVLIYAGAILVTYLFVIMLAQQPGSPIYDRRTREPFLAVVVGFVLMAMIAGRAGELPALAREKAILADGGPNPPSTASLLTGNTMAIGSAVTTKYVVALELAGILLLISMVGAIALSRKQITSDVIRSPHRALGQIGKEVEPF